MERLTERNEANTAYYYPNCFRECDGLGYSRKCDKCGFQDKVCDKLGEYEDLEEQGKLLKLPCKAGQKVYLLRKDIKTVIGGEITSIRIGEFASEIRIFIVDDNRYTGASFDKIGDIVFFTQEEAEVALKEL